MGIINLQDKNLFYIGGVVRDELLGKKSFDIDLTYQGNAIKYAETIPDAEILQINEPFGTVRIKLNNQEIDIASTRDETYPQKGHLPHVENIGCSLKDDILRRDFTVNALAKSTLTGEIIDYTGGLEDLKNKKLKVLHSQSFIDDPTRIVRGLKFAIRFDFELDEHTKKLQDEYLKNINYDMSYKRLKKELVETFNLNSQKAFEKRFKDAGIPNESIPDIWGDQDLRDRKARLIGLLKEDIRKDSENRNKNPDYSSRPYGGGALSGGVPQKSQEEKSRQARERKAQELNKIDKEILERKNARSREKSEQEKRRDRFRRGE